MEGMSAAAIVQLAAKLVPNTIKAIEAVRKIKGRLDERKIQEDIENSLRDGQRAFRAFVPSGKTVDTEILDSFFHSSVFVTQCQKLLEGEEPDLTLLEQAFYEAGYVQGSVPGFNPRLAIVEFFKEFVQSAGRKDSLAGVATLRLLYDGNRRRYCDQVVRAYRNLSFAGVPAAYDQNPVKLEEIFITLQASHRVPEADIIGEGNELLESRRQRRPAEEIHARETIEIVSMTEILAGNNNMVILGAPGSGKTTFMKYLALTFAQKLSSERLKLDEDRLPILITIQDIATDLCSGKTITDVLSKHIKSELQLVDLPDDYFLPYLNAGRCIILFDGLDEVASTRERGDVAEKVRRFSSLYKGNRYIITSRIAGYREIQRLPESDFAHFTIRDFDDDQIRDFARKWYLTRYPLEARKRTQDLIEAIERSPRVRQLAINPLMLTIIAIVHRGSAELPNQRIKLYDLCSAVLISTWQRERNREALTDMHGRLISDTEVRRRLEQMAYWMHSLEEGQVRYTRLCSKLAEQLVGRKRMDPEEAEIEAEHFLEHIRKNTGVILERGTEWYGFIHLTFQEYFAAWEICRRCRGDADKVWKEVSACLHDSHWREVILLLIAKLDELYPDVIGQELIQKILGADTPYEDLLKRDLLLAGACLADGVSVEDKTCEQILDDTVEMLRSPYNLQREHAADVLRDLVSSWYGDYVINRLLALLSDEAPSVRWRVADALGSIGKSDERVIGKLLELLSDAEPEVRWKAADALGKIGRTDERLIDKLLGLLDDRDADVRAGAATALGGIGKSDERVIDKLLELLNDTDTDVRWNTADALGNIGRISERVIDKLLELLVDVSVRTSVVGALANIGRFDERVTDKLLKLLDDDRDSGVRAGALDALGSIGRAGERVIDKLVELLDSDVCTSAADALGSIGEADERAMGKLLQLLDDLFMRSSAANALGNIGRADKLVIDKLLELFPSNDPAVRRSAASALGSIGEADERVIDELLGLLCDDDPFVRRSAADALGNIVKASGPIIGRLLQLLSNETPSVRSSAANALGSIGKPDERITDRLLELLDDQDLSVRISAVDALGSVAKADERVIGKLVQLLDDKDQNQGVHRNVAIALGNIETPNRKVLDALRNVCRDLESFSLSTMDPVEDLTAIRIYDLAFRALWRYAPSS